MSVPILPQRPSIVSFGVILHELFREVSGFSKPPGEMEFTRTAVGPEGRSEVPCEAVTPALAAA